MSDCATVDNVVTWSICFSGQDEMFDCLSCDRYLDLFAIPQRLRRTAQTINLPTLKHDSLHLQCF